jgi:hypothetical protein
MRHFAAFRVWGIYGMIRSMQELKKESFPWNPIEWPFPFLFLSQIYLVAIAYTVIQLYYVFNPLSSSIVQKGFATPPSAEEEKAP